jgi:hypothetical protein
MKLVSSSVPPHERGDKLVVEMVEKLDHHERRILERDVPALRARGEYLD